MAVVTLYDAMIATAGVIAVEGSLPDLASFKSKQQFFTVVCATSALAVLGRLLYQRALSIAPLSLTVPYLAFTPAFVVLLSPLFLVGEVPSPVGMLGVFVVSLSGYMLGLVTAPGVCDKPCSPSKAKLPPSSTSLRKSASANTLVQTQQQQEFHALPHSQEDLQQWPQDQYQQQHFHEQWNDHNHSGLIDNNSSSSRGKSRGSQLSVWAMAYYKGKAVRSPASTVAAAGELQQYIDPPAGPGHLLSSTGSAKSGGGMYDSSNCIRVVCNSSNSCKNSESSRWHDYDSQAKVSKDTSRVESKLGNRAQAASNTAAASRAAKLAGHRSGRSSIQRTFAAVTAAFSGPSAAPALVLMTAFLYSLTASLDKLGIAAANHSLAAYFLWQRLIIGACGAVYLLCFARHALRHLVRDMLLLISISVVEQLAVVFYLIAISNMLVSYVVAIKRTNVLMSTLIGCVLFKENVRQRIPYIIVMLGGMLMIVLQPGHEYLHHNHHTRHLHHNLHNFMLL